MSEGSVHNRTALEMSDPADQVGRDGAREVDLRWGEGGRVEVECLVESLVECFV
jgi:hypothetical protein